MKECRHGIDADACELCQEHIRAVAGRRREGHGRPLTLSQERRDEIARIAEQRRWKDLIWSDMRITPSKELTKEKRRAALRTTMRAKWQDVDTKASRVRALLAANPDMRTSDVSRATGALVPMVSTIRREMGLPRQKKLGSPKMVITQDALADPEKVAIMRRVLALLRRGYVAARISQLLDIPEKHVRSYIAAVKDPNIKLPRVVKSRPMTEEDLQTAYTLWKEGNTYVSIAAKLDRDLNQIRSAMLALLRSLGEK